MKIKISFAPINTGFAINGIFTDEIFNFHKNRSGPNIDISYVGNVAVSEKRTTNSRTATFKKENQPKLEHLAEIIKQEGSKAGIQIASRRSLAPATVGWRGDSSRITALRIKEILELKETEIEKEINDVIECSKTAIRLGFDVIQIHAAHGYFISSLLTKEFNLRKDKFSYDSSYIFEKIANSLPSQHHKAKLAIRINSINGISSKENEHDNTIELISKLIKSDFSIISLSNGIYDINKELIYPINNNTIRSNHDRAVIISKSFNDTEFEFSGHAERLTTNKLNNAPQNLSHLLGRELIANPDISKDITLINDNICNDCNSCHYYTSQKDHITCPHAHDLQ